MRRIAITIVMATLLAGLSLAADGTDWPGWRGPTGDGISPEQSWRSEAVAKGPTVLWKAELGKGYSALSISDGRAYSMGNVNDEDIVYCLNAKSGREFWRHVYACKGSSYPGPRATPLVADGRVYTFGRAGDVFCLDAKTGTIVWKRNVVSELKAKVPRWGFAGSPVLDGQRLLINAGPHGLALDRLSGKTLWQSGAGMGGYAAPVVTTLAGKATVLMLGETGLSAVDPASGKRRWFSEWITKYNVNAADPVPLGKRVWVGSGYDRGCTLLDCSGAQPRRVWENKAMRAHFSTPVLHQGYLYGIDGNAGRGNLVCLKPDSGETVWSQSLGFGSLILAGDRLIMLNEKGSLYVADASPSGYSQQAMAENLLPAKCWTAPVLSHGLLYLRNDAGRVLCLDLR